MPASLTKLLKTHRWLIIGLAISIIDILAEWNAIDDPIPTGWSSFHYLINDLLLLVMIFVMIPLDAPREYILSLEATKKRHIGTSPDSSLYDPDLWTDEYYFLNQPGQADIQLDLFYDYQNNVKSYPKWQQWLRDHQPPLLVVWGRYDTSFTIAGAEAYKKDDPRAEVHSLDAGHFAMDLKPDEIVTLTQSFMEKLHLH
jgi:pimeloyl-ACP methyl ester carboxylesterase